MTVTRRLIALAALAAIGASGQSVMAQPAPSPALSSASRYLETPPGEKPRVVVTTDPELDDLNTLIRFLLYSTDFRTEGLIYASSQFHWSGDGKGTRLSVPGREYTRIGRTICPCTSWRWGEDERFIDDALDAYTAAYPKLRVHDSEYPSPEWLRSKVRWGNVEFDGEMAKDTAGSDLIRSLLLDEEASPIYLHAWGGQSTIARALKSIEEDYQALPNWAEIRAKVVGKAVIHASGDQDDTYRNYIAVQWPDIRYRELRDGFAPAYNAQATVSEEDAQLLSAEWTRENVSSRGPLGQLYRVWGDGKQMVEGDIFDFFGLAGRQTTEELRAKGYVVWTPLLEPGAFISEGDTGTFLNLVDNGLRGFRAESFGGWGGLLLDGSFNYGDQGAGLMERPEDRNAPRRAPTQWFFAPAQHDFAARLRWATTPDYKNANHHPRIELLGSNFISAKPGEAVPLKAATGDPDGDPVVLRWWRWDVADDYAGSVDIRADGDSGANVTVPRQAKPGETIHVIAEATDGGTPALTRYERIVIRVAP